MLTLIPGLRDSLTYQTAAELYQRHRDGGAGTCRTCGDSTPCPSQRHATFVIIAAGEDLRSYDTRQVPAAPGDFPGRRQMPTAHRSETGVPAAPSYTGYRLGGRGRGRGRPASPDGYFYDRD